MSFDLMVFRAEAAPKDTRKFEEWYHQQTEWSEDVDYNDHSHTSPILREWFLEMQQTFPSLNGPLAVDDDNVDYSNVTDYSIGTDVIYAAFRWSEAEEAYQKMYELAAKHGTGFYDPQGDALFFPGNNQNLEPLIADKKPWWKIW